MHNRLRALVQFDNLLPAAIVLVALFVAMEPRVAGVQIADRQVILILFALLALDSVVERSGRLRRIDNGFSALQRNLTGKVGVGQVLRTRASFKRMDSLVRDARRHLIIIGVNLDGAVAALATIVDLAKAGVEVVLVALDPDGDTLAAGAQLSGIPVEIRRQKIRQNLQLISAAMESRLPTAARRKCRLRVVDRVLPIGVVGVDTGSRNGVLVVQHYLLDTPAGRAPMLELHRQSDPEWYERYLDQCAACIASSKEW